MNKVAIITGSSGGIGESLITTYKEDDFFVIGIDKRIDTKADDNYLPINIDLFRFSKDEKYRRSSFEKIFNALPDDIFEIVLVNNAATQIIKPLAEINWMDWESSFAINTIAPFFFAQGLKHKLSEAKGHIINISSIHSKLTKSNFSYYAASKAALESITRSLTLEVSSLGISVNAVAPAAIETSMLIESFNNRPEGLNELKSFHPSGSVGTPEQLALFVKSISDQKGGFLTGAILDFNGGISGRLHDPV